MKAPKCRVCGYQHWNSEPHVFQEASGGSSKVDKKPKLVSSNAQRQQKHREKMRSLGRKPWLIEVTDDERKALKIELERLRK